MDPLIKFKQESEKVIAHLTSELKSFRTGKASPSIVEEIQIEAYSETKLRLKEVAAITTLDSASLLVKPFDPSILNNIEKGILRTPLGITPQVQGGQIILKFPPLTEEQRQKLIKFLNQIIEEKRNIIRRIRDESRKIIKTQFEEKKITEDQRFRWESQLDEEIKNFMNTIDQIKNKKEVELSSL
jgi:ribosome recycling factor